MSDEPEIERVIQGGGWFYKLNVGKHEVHLDNLMKHEVGFSLTELLSERERGGE